MIGKFLAAMAVFSVVVVVGGEGVSGVEDVDNDVGDFVLERTDEKAEGAIKKPTEGKATNETAERNEVPRQIAHRETFAPIPLLAYMPYRGVPLYTPF